MTLHLIHSLRSSPCPSPSFPLLWVHLSSHFLKRASRTSHPFHLGRIHPYPPLEPGATWRSCLRLWPHLRNERPRSSGGAEMRRRPLVAAWRVSRKVLRAGRGAEPDKSHWASWCLLSSLPSRLSFSCAWPPTFPARIEPHWLSHCFLLTFHGDLSMNPGFTADFAANGSFNALCFHTPSQCDCHPRPLPCLLVPVTRVSFSFCLFLFSFPKSTHQETNRMIHSIAQILHSFIPSQTHSLVRFLPFLSYCLCLI